MFGDYRKVLISNLITIQDFFTNYINTKLAEQNTTKRNQ